MEVLDHRFGPGTDLELAVDAAEVLADGIGIDPQRGADFLVQKALGQLLKDCLLPGRERRKRIRRGRALEVLNHLARDVRGHGGASLAGLTNRVQDLWGGCVLEEVSAGARREGIENGFGVLVDGEHHEGQIGHCGREASHAFHAT